MNMSIDKVIEILDSGKAPETEQDFLDFDTAIETAINLLKNYPDNQPNDPLTMEQLRKMDGEPVWLVINNNRGQWAIVIIDHEEFISFICADENAFEFDLYGDNDGVEWSAYRRKPEEGKTSG